MPWHISTSKSECSGYAVVKDSDGSIAGCHDTRSEAEDQLAALYANERGKNVGLILEELIERITRKVRGLPVQPKEEPTRRAVDLMQVGEELQRIGFDMFEVDEDGWHESYYLSRIMVGDDGMYAVYSHRGKLYRAEITVTGSDVGIGELQEVEVHHTPVSRTWVKREADGKLRIYMIAGVAAINRDGEIDSRALFDSFVARADASGFYPKIDWYHLGSELSIGDVGQCDFVARAQNAYLASGVLNESNPLTAKIVERIESGGVGCSVEYYPMLRMDGTPDTETIFVGDVPVTVYRDGLNTRIALLPEQHASHILTSTMSERTVRMTADQARKLRALFDSDAEFEKFVSTVEGVERSAAEAVTREAGEGTDTPEAVAEMQDGEADVSDPAAADDAEEDVAGEEDDAEIALSEELVGAIARQAAEVIMREQGEALEALATALTTLNEEVSGQLAGMNERLAAVEKSREVDLEEATEDLSARVLRDAKLKFTYRPREKQTVTREQATGGEGTVDVDDVLSRMPALFERK